MRGEEYLIGIGNDGWLEIQKAPPRRTLRQRLKKWLDLQRHLKVLRRTRGLGGLCCHCQNGRD